MTPDESGMAAVLAEHEDPTGWTCDADGMPVYECLCGDQSSPLSHDYIYPKDVEAAGEWHRAHVAAALAEAGYGHVGQARAEALREAADEADSIGHHWSGAFAHDWFEFANSLRDRADREAGDQHG